MPGVGRDCISKSRRLPSEAADSIQVLGLGCAMGLRNQTVVGGLRVNCTRPVRETISISPVVTNY